MDPLAKVETFQVETVARRVLKELVETYMDVQNEQSKTIKSINSETEKTKNKMTQLESLVKKLKDTCTEALGLQKRVNMLDEVVRGGKDLAEKKHENLKELIKQGDAVLEHRIEAFEKLEDKVNIISDELVKNRGVHDDYRRRIFEELTKANSEHAATKAELHKHLNDYTATFTNNEFFMDKCNSQMRTFESNLASLKAYLDSKVESVQFDCSRRVRIDDMK